MTYRLYDYNRKDKDGNARPLHIDKALQVIDYKKKDNINQKMRIRRYKNGYLKEFLYRCKYFEVYREKINNQTIDFKTNSTSFHVLLILDGVGKINFDKEYLNIKKGDCIFVPANSIDMRISGKIELLNINC